MTAIEALAAKLRRPADAWPALARLPADDLERLSAAIDRAASRQTEGLTAAVERAIPRPLAKRLLARLRRVPR